MKLIQFRSFLGSVCAAVALMMVTVMHAQTNSAATAQPVALTADEDRQKMMDQLGITALRPGASGDEKAPDHANYDESQANPFPNLPDPLTMKNGEKVTTPEMWWKRRRPEIVEDYRARGLRARAGECSGSDVDGGRGRP